jgi:ArsR family transcriptional regulator
MNAEELENGSVPESMTAVLKALSDPNRLRIFAALLRGVPCNGWLTEELGLPANLLSHHLKVLREAGLVQDRRDAMDGRWIYYQVDVSILTSIHQWLGDILNPIRVAMQHLCGPEGIAAHSPETAPSAQNTKLIEEHY